ncbi:MAG TPA: DUF2779 domain-containing protein [Gemmatimonadales bacterium]
MRTLSKSDYKLARTCSTKLYYREKGYPQRTDDDPMLRLLAEGGYMVEQLARLFFPDGRALEYGRDAERDWDETRRALAAERVTLFEATLLSNRMLARVDVLRKTGNVFDLIEIKSKSLNSDSGDDGDDTGGFRTAKNVIRAAWRPYLEDVAYQVHVLRQLFPEAEIRPRLIVVDTALACPWDRAPEWFRVTRDVDGRDLDVRFVGDAAAVDPAAILSIRDVGDEVAELLPEVAAIAAHLAGLYHGDEVLREENPLAWSCRGCEFRVALDEPRNGFLECWQDAGRVTPHIFDLWKLGSLARKADALPHRLIERRAVSLLDIPIDELGVPRADGGGLAHRQIRQIEHMRSGEPYQDLRLLEAFAPLTWPLHFIDFEALQLAIPPFRGLHAYEKLPFQWSCHTVAAPGATPVSHHWLAQGSEWCSADFAASLRDAVGDRGTLLTWTGYESAVLAAVASQHGRCGNVPASLLEWLGAARTSVEAGGRIFDMEKACARFYLHPLAGGRTSIKPLLDAIWKSDPVVEQQYRTWVGEAVDVLQDKGPYESLPAEGSMAIEVRDGIGAMNAYRAILFDPILTEDDRIAARLGLLRYCELDTLAMVLLWDHWVRQAAAGREPASPSATG